MSGKGGDYRPITDTWILAPNKVGYYGGFSNGFVQRARCLLCRMGEPLLHVCSGKIRQYPGYGIGPVDKTLDINPNMFPDFLQDARDPWPTVPEELCDYEYERQWPAILTDPPYTPDDADHYDQYLEGMKFRDVLPSPSQLITRAWEVLRPGGKFGILHYLHPKAPKYARVVACIQVVQGTNARPRVYTVLEKEWPYGEVNHVGDH